MPRPIWKGSITFGLVNIPVTLYTAEKKNELHFNLIDSRNHARIRYERVNEVTGEEVPWENIVKGYESDGGNFVLLSDEDFKRADVEATQTIEIEAFVDREALDYVFFEKPYYLLPPKKGDKGYVLLREVLKRTGKIGIARVVIRTREYLAALIPEGKALVLDLLRYAQELIDTSEFEFPEEGMEKYKISEREIKMAESLVENMYSKWDPDKYHDKYREALMEWIKKKIETGQTEATPEAPQVEEEAAGGKVIDLMELLRKSVERTSSKEKRSERVLTTASGKVHSRARKKTSSR